MNAEMFTYFILYFYCQTLSCLALSEWNTARVQSVFPDDSVSASDTAAGGFLSSPGRASSLLVSSQRGAGGRPRPCPPVPIHASQPSMM